MNFIIADIFMYTCTAFLSTVKFPGHFNSSFQPSLPHANPSAVLQVAN